MRHVSHLQTQMTTVIEIPYTETECQTFSIANSFDVINQQKKKQSTDKHMFLFQYSKRTILFYFCLILL